MFCTIMLNFLLSLKIGSFKTYLKHPINKLFPKKGRRTPHNPLKLATKLKFDLVFSQYLHGTLLEPHMRGSEVTLSSLSANDPKISNGHSGYSLMVHSEEWSALHFNK